MVIKSWRFERTVNNKKTRTPCFSTLHFSRISPEPLELQKTYLHLFISVFEDLKQELFKFDDTIS